MVFDYLENVAFAACVCDKDGVVHQNARSVKRDSDVEAIPMLYPVFDSDIV